MSSQHDVLEVDDRETNVDEKKKRWKGLRDVFNTFQWYSEGDEDKVDKITKSSRGIVIWGRTFERQKTIFLRNLLAGGVNWFAHDWLMQQGSTMWSWPIISDSFLKCVNETFVKREMWCSQKVSNTYELKRKVKIAPYWKSGAQFLLWTLTRKLCPK